MSSNMLNLLEEVTESGTRYVVRSEEAAIELLQLAHSRKLPEHCSVTFDGWPSLDMHIKGAKFESSLTSTVMKGLIEFQKGLYHSYATAKYNDAKRRLTEEERRQLEVKVNVGGGSTGLEINFPDIATKFIEQLGNKLNGPEIILLVVSVAVLYFGRSAFRDFLDHRKDVRALEVSDETQKEQLNTMRFISEQETQRMQIVREIAQNNPKVAAIADQSYESKTELLKGLSAGDTAELEGVPLTAGMADLLTRNHRRKSNEVRLDGVYRIVRIDWSDVTHARVRVVDHAGQELDAVVQDETMDGRYKSALRSAEWGRGQVFLEMNAKKLDDVTFRDAVILSARETKS